MCCFSPLHPMSLATYCVLLHNLWYFFWSDSLTFFCFNFLEPGLRNKRKAQIAVETALVNASSYKDSLSTTSLINSRLVSAASEEMSNILELMKKRGRTDCPQVVHLHPQKIGCYQGCLTYSSTASSSWRDWGNSLKVFGPSPGNFWFCKKSIKIFSASWGLWFPEFLLEGSRQACEIRVSCWTEWLQPAWLV